MQGVKVALFNVENIATSNWNEAAKGITRP
jgi:hypothetical protein